MGKNCLCPYGNAQRNQHIELQLLLVVTHLFVCNERIADFKMHKGML